MRKLATFVIFCSTFALALPAFAAKPVYQGDGTSVSVLGLTRVGYRVTETDGAWAGQTFLRFGRIGTVVQIDDIGRAKVVGEFAGGASMLDVIGELTLFNPLTIRAGFYKSPLSLEFDTAPNAIPFVGRTALLGRIAPARLAGSELELNIGDSDLSVEGRLGIWNPAPLPLREDRYAGQYIIPKLGLHIGGFGQIHVAYLEHVFAENPTVPANRPAPYDRQVDFGVWIEPGTHFRMIAEGLVAFEGPFGDEAYGAHVQALYRIGDWENDFVYAPALAYDFVDDAQDGEEHTVRAGLNVHISQFALVTGFYYGALYNTDTELTSNTLELQFQGEF